MYTGPSLVLLVHAVQPDEVFLGMAGNLHSVLLSNAVQATSLQGQQLVLVSVRLQYVHELSYSGKTGSEHSFRLRLDPRTLHNCVAVNCLNHRRQHNNHSFVECLEHSQSC